MHDAGDDTNDELLDLAVIAELDDLDGGVWGDLLVLYFDESAAMVSQLAAAIVLDDPLAVSQTAHRLKGSSSTIGAGRVSQLAAELDATARAGDLSGAGDIMDELRDAIDATRSALDARPS